MKSINFLNINISSYNLHETKNLIQASIDNNHQLIQTSINVSKAVQSQKDLKLRDSVNQSDIVNIDGYGIYFVLRLLGYKNIERIAGIDLFEELLLLSNQHKYSIFCLGGSEQVISKTREKIKKKYPNIILSGFHHGYIWNNEREVVELIKRTRPNILFIGISSPMKENFINKWKDYIGANLYMGVGGSFEVLIGKVNRAPVFIQQIGFEWLYRVWQEPLRLWKRYLITNTLYIFYVLKFFIKLKFKI